MMDIIILVSIGVLFTMICLVMFILNEIVGDLEQITRKLEDM